MTDASYFGALPRAYLAACRQALEQNLAWLIPANLLLHCKQLCQVVLLRAARAAPILALSMTNPATSAFLCQILDLTRLRTCVIMGS